MYAYSNHGMTMRAIDLGMETDEEVVFDRIATEDELLAAFPRRADVLRAQARERQEAHLTAVLQAHLDAAARTRGYDGILSLCSYDGDLDPVFAAEGREGKKFRSATWRYGYQILADVEAGTRPIPTEAELVAGAPVMMWP